MTEWSPERIRSKAKMLAMRTVFEKGRRLYRCDLCRGNFPGLEMHEIISRSQTVGNDEARLRSFDEHLCCLLCHECHETAGTRGNEALCWFALYDLYGRGDLMKGYHIVGYYYGLVEEVLPSGVITPLEKVENG